MTRGAKRRPSGRFLHRSGPLGQEPSRPGARQQSALPVTFVATARVDPNDSEWLRRSRATARSVRAGWNVVETGVDPPVDLPRYVAAADAERTLWSTRSAPGSTRASCARSRRPATTSPRSTRANAEARRLIEALQATRAQTIVIGEEVGWGIVPLAASARIFRDVAGRAQQRIAALAQRSYLVVAGHAIDIRAATSPDGLAPEGWR